MFFRSVILATLFVSSIAAPAQAPSARWTEAQANAWYAQQPWLVGANFVPSDAINQLEMFQAATFNPALNDKELGMGESIGMNTMRVFLQDQLWQQDPDGFKHRLDIFLSIAARHHIRPLLVLFDSCWETNPHLGPQHPPIPGVHNSGWVQSPGKERLLDPSVEPQLKSYVQGIVGAFANDQRILGWDIWNEPDNKGATSNKMKPPRLSVSMSFFPKPSPGRVRCIRHSPSPAASGKAIGPSMASNLPPPKFS
jgi:hypothetical protein